MNPLSNFCPSQKIALSVLNTEIQKKDFSGSPPTSIILHENDCLTEKNQSLKFFDFQINDSHDKKFQQKSPDWGKLKKIIFFLRN